MPSNHFGGDPEEMTAADWSNGLCDVFALALSRRYGLPMLGAFELLGDGKLGFLCHAFCQLPDGRAIDAFGPAAMFTAADCDSGPDPEVVGFAIVPTGAEDLHLRSLERFDYEFEIEALQADLWIDAQLGAVLAQLGLAPREPTSPALR